MGAVIFTSSAEKDLEEILDFTLVEWGSIQAVKYLDDIETMLSNLAENPKVGMCRDSIEAGLFSFPISSHVAYYMINKEGIIIMRLLHASMDPVRHL